MSIQYAMHDSGPNPFYYLANFERALEWVRARYEDLLSQQEHAFLSRFQQLPQPARALLVRLLMRVGVIFRRSKVRYPEIEDLDAALCALSEAGWIDLDPEMDASQFTSVLTRDELACWASCRRATKVELSEELILRHGAERRRASQWPYLEHESLLCVSIAPLADRFRLLFFGNARQDWREFVLVDLGIFTYESLPLDESARAFKCRQDIEDFFALTDARAAFEREAPVDEVLARIPAHPIAHHWLDRRRAKLLFDIARDLERAGELQAALTLYARSPYFGARFRTVRTLERLGRTEQAYALAQQNVPPAEVLMLERARSRIGRRFGRARDRATPRHLATTDLILDTWECVELGAAASLAKADAPVFYVENSLFNALFGLLYWDSIFAPIPGAFFHPFQRGPADLWTQEFCEPRAELIARSNQLLDRQLHGTAILSRYDRSQGILNPFVSWHLAPALLMLAIGCIPSRHLRWIFDRMWSHLSVNSTGFPDLIQFDLESHSYQLFEVKGPGDRVQDHQRAWLMFFADHGIPASVCHVRQRAQA